MIYDAFRYSLKVWLTSVILSPILYVLVDSVLNPKYISGLLGIFGFISYSIPYGLMLSIPSWGLLWISCIFINKRTATVRLKKIILSIIGAILSLLPFYLLFHLDDDNAHEDVITWSICYSVIIIAGVWFYKLSLNHNRDKSIVKE